MTVKVNQNLCNGCNGIAESRCEAVCPGNLMTRDAEQLAYIRSSKDCWDCMACVKACPQQALQTKLPFQLAGYGSKLVPKSEKKQIHWTLTHPDGKVETFTIPTESI
ncbi:4Fe-4S dicluster domain-containing protein [Desulfuribacillus alkaliarsenatis]|uniref:4Fe-4S ferredoxin-type domain-containing protein n=1 Tax=Desulfuribacillus alkaliarsenatis TaxID=766136 RepID=A0A1E5G3K0_9FIRM|nr:4Fe-4S dicluster domain-containing protein [Desulfuribacillus alkaliarsenatis]OEF97664.1 hypothetical protein BHF68_14265 [Desulfuribacillus alkaliarsenatis]